MSLAEVMAALESMGTAQNRKVYARHGAGENTFGVSFADLAKLKKRIKTDHALARELWSTGNTDARTLATMVADPAQATAELLDRWLEDIRDYGLAYVFARNLASRSPLALDKMAAWTRSSTDYTSQAGWVIVAVAAMDNPSLEEALFERYLETIETDIHQAKNRTRHAMNSALIAIGLRSTGLRNKALAAAARIGKVEVDHGETGCTTPDAAAYIRKGSARPARKAPASKKPAAST